MNYKKRARKITDDFIGGKLNTSFDLDRAIIRLIKKEKDKSYNKGIEKGYNTGKEYTNW